jgi:hypothetical protein
VNEATELTLYACYFVGNINDTKAAVKVLFPGSNAAKVMAEGGAEGLGRYFFLWAQKYLV